MKSGPVLDEATGLACGSAPSTSEIRLLPSRTPIQSYAVALGTGKGKTDLNAKILRLQALSLTPHPVPKRQSPRVIAVSRVSCFSGGRSLSMSCLLTVSIISSHICTFAGDSIISALYSPVPMRNETPPVWKGY